MRKFSTFLFLLIGTLFFTSCISHESLVSYQNDKSRYYNQSIPIENQKTIQVQPNDVLDIKVHTQDLTTAAPFNKVTDSANGFISNPDLLQLNGYLVDKKGYITFPVIGDVKVSGMSIGEVKTALTNSLEKYLTAPVVNVRFLNFKVTISGEVRRPGSFTVYNDRITLPEVISMAGDLTPYAKRDSILIVREFDGERSFSTVDLTSSKFFESDYYFLQQNDYIYIEPIEAKRGAVNDNSNKILPFVSAAVSIAALLITAFR